MAALVAILVFVLGGSSDDEPVAASPDGTEAPASPTSDATSPTSTGSPAAPGAASATLAFEPVVYDDGTSVERSWMVVVGDEPRLVGTLTVTAPEKKAATAVHVEVIPKAVAADVAEIDFSDEPTEIIAADPIVAYSLAGMKAGTTREITYVARLQDIGADDDPQAVLDALLDAQRRAQGQYDEEQARRVVSLSITPELNLLLPLQQVRLVVEGERANGKRVVADDLEGVEWSSSDESIAVVGRGGLVTAGNVGEAKITVRSGDLKATVVVTVLPPPTTTTTLPPVSQTTRPPTNTTPNTPAPTTPTTPPVTVKE